MRHATKTKVRIGRTLSVYGGTATEGRLKWHKSRVWCYKDGGVEVA